MPRAPEGTVTRSGWLRLSSDRSIAGGPLSLPGLERGRSRANTVAAKASRESLRGGSPGPTPQPDLPDYGLRPQNPHPTDQTLHPTPWGAATPPHTIVWRVSVRRTSTRRYVQHAPISSPTSPGTCAEGSVYAQGQQYRVHRHWVPTGASAPASRGWPPRPLAASRSRSITHRRPSD
jgi:hypothetical protein